MSSKLPGVTVSAFPQCWGNRCMLPCQLLHRYWGSIRRFLGFYSRLFTHWAISLAPQKSVSNRVQLFPPWRWSGWQSYFPGFSWNEATRSHLVHTDTYTTWPTSREAESEVGEHIQTNSPRQWSIWVSSSHWSQCSQSLTSQLLGRWRQEDYKFVSAKTNLDRQLSEPFLDSKSRKMPRDTATGGVLA